MDIACKSDYVNNENLITHYIKKYPDRYKLIRFKTPYPPNTSNKENKKTKSSWLQSEDDRLDSEEQSLARTRTTLTDLTICNVFDLFVTFTLNCRACTPKCKNKPKCTCDRATCMRFNLDYALRTQKGWYNNQIKKYGRFPYVQVMELHKNKGIHFHALFANYPGELTFWKIDKKDGRKLYNLASNKKGWTTVKKIYDISGASSYVRKYIMKDMPVFPGKKRYWASQGLKRPIVIQDPELMEQILANPTKQVWEPKAEVSLRENGSLKLNSSNLHSITTLMAEHEESYLKEFAVLKRLEKLEKSIQLQAAPLAHARLNRISQATPVDRLTVDSPALSTLEPKV